MLANQANNDNLIENTTSTRARNKRRTSAII